MAVTVKTVKKKKPLSLKKPGGPAGAPAEGAVEGAEGAVAGAPVAAAAPAKPVAPVKKASYTFAGVCAILEFLMFAAILTLQILEWKHYLAPPKSAFPPFGTILPIPTGASTAPATTDAVDDFNVDGSDDFLADEEAAAGDVVDEEAIPAE